MKPLYRLPSVSFFLSLLFSHALYATETDHHLQQVETLFQLTQMEKKINESVDSVVQMQLSQNPQYTNHQAAIKAFFEKYIGWHALKNDISAMYLRTFSAAELEKINAFYITPAGQKVINVVPELVKERNQLSMTRLQQNIAELQKLVSEAPSP
jgi:hypothetical protein